MDVISEIKKFEQHPERAKFSDLQINDFYKSLAGKPVTFEAIISSVKKGTNSDCDIHAETYAYSIQHNPVAGRDYLDWRPDMHFICQANRSDFKFNPLTDLTRGERIRCQSTFIEKQGTDIIVHLNTLNRIPFLESEKEKELLEKKFNTDYEERTVFAPQRQTRSRAFSKVYIFASIGAILGGLCGLFWASFGAMFNEDAPFLSVGLEGAIIGAFFLGGFVFLRSMFKPPKRDFNNY